LFLAFGMIISTNLFVAVAPTPRLVRAVAVSAESPASRRPGSKHTIASL
jgi:hypothetical protein